MEIHRIDRRGDKAGLGAETTEGSALALPS
jgi:hypothetical protein